MTEPDFFGLLVDLPALLLVLSAGGLPAVLSAGSDSSVGEEIVNPALIVSS